MGHSSESRMGVKMSGSGIIVDCRFRGVRHAQESNRIAIRSKLLDQGTWTSCYLRTFEDNPYVESEFGKKYMANAYR